MSLVIQEVMKKMLLMTRKIKVIDKIGTGIKVDFIPYFFLFLFWILMLSCSGNSSSEKELTKSFDKNHYLKHSNKDSIREVISELPDSPAKNNLLFDISYHFYSDRNIVDFRYWNKKAFELSRSLRDTTRIAEAHWDLGNFFYRGEVIDSAFYHYRKAAQYYNTKGDEFLYARMLLNIGILQKNIKDYSNSESNTLTALKIVLPLEEHRQIYIGYNNLGILYNQLSEYENAIIYHNKAFLSAKKLADGYLEAASLNNIGVVYEKMGLYKKAIDYYEQALKIPDVATEHARLYAMLKDNVAYSKFKLGKDSGVLKEMLEALRLREQAGHEAGIAINKLHLGEYFLVQGDTLRGNDYFLQAKELAEEMHLHRDILESLLFLSRSDKQKSNEYLKKYISLHDSLEQKERSVRSKFARIELETEQFIAENEQLTEQRKWILGGAGSLFTMLVMFFVIWRQKANNKKLSLEREQQQANEEIYNLLLEQEKKIELGKQKEKDRISRELHDGVLGEMYGVRFNLINLNSRSDVPALKTKENLLNRLQKVEEDIRLISRDLQNNEKLEEVGFLNLITQLCHEFSEIADVKVRVISDDQINWSAVSNRVKMNLYRITQEAFHNMEKYAAAEKAEVSFKICRRQLVVEIRDNGRGFDVHKSSPGIGLKNMEFRVRELSGDFRIHSGEEGTEILIKIPIDE